MSGSGRKSQYRKSVTETFLTKFPEPVEGSEYIAKIVATKGGNIFAAMLSDGREEAIYMPKKFKNLLWIKRGDYVIVTGGGDKEELKDQGIIGGVKFEIIHIVNHDHIKHLVERQLWPSSIFPLENFKDKDRSYNGKEELMPGYNSDEYEEFEEEEEVQLEVAISSASDKSGENIAVGSSSSSSNDSANVKDIASGSSDSSIHGVFSGLNISGSSDSSSTNNSGSSSNSSGGEQNSSICSTLNGAEK